MARTGRPPKDARLRMNVPVRIMVTAEQKQLLDAAVALENEELSGWGRAILLRAAKDRLARARVRKAEQE
jgi:uncharacterized protein (DUF1778 family)